MPIHRHEFKVDQGYRWYRDDISLLTMTCGLANPLSEEATFNFAKIQGEYLSKAGMSVALPKVFCPSVRRSQFADRRRGRMYKWISQEDWESYYSRGKFQLGTSAFYRASENAKIKDGSEGLSFLTLASREKQLCLFVEVGSNVGIFCGADRAVDAKGEMQKRFGSALIEVTDTNAFAMRIASIIGAVRYHVHDIVYSDAKTFRHPANLDAVKKILSEGGGDFSDAKIQALNVSLFDRLYRLGLLSSVFCKPATRYNEEMERRIAFEMPADLEAPVLQFEDRQLLNYVNLIES